MATEREREMAAEDSIKVVCRFRPLNDSEEKAGSKFVVKFPSGPDENCISIGVSHVLILLVLCLLSLVICTHLRSDVPPTPPVLK